MREKIKVYHFYNGSGGGVLSVITNLLRYSNIDQFENHLIHTKSEDSGAVSKPVRIENVISEQIFTYSSKWNFNYTSKKLAKLIQDDSAVLVAHDWLELGMISHVGKSNPVIHVLHGHYDYYYELARKHKDSVDQFVTVSQLMADRLKALLPERADQICYLPFPVPDSKFKAVFNKNRRLNIIFIGRLTAEKGYPLLPVISQGLIIKNIEVRWHIVGEAAASDKLVWDERSDVEFYGLLTNEKLLDLMQQMDCFILPSIAEGMPVTLVEAMKVGLTSIVNHLPGGIDEFITSGTNGYTVSDNCADSYVDIIEKLNFHRVLLEALGNKANSIAKSKFDPIINAARYEELIKKCFENKARNKKIQRVYGSRLDKSWIPNFITKTLRGLGGWQ